MSGARPRGWALPDAGDATYTNTNAMDFAGLGALVGGGGNDDFTFTGTNALSVTIDGAGGTDTADYSGVNPVSLTVGTDVVGIEELTGSAGSTLTAANGVANTWAVTGVNEGTVTGLTSFFDFSNLVAGDTGDSLTFQAAGEVDGSVTGGAGAESFVFADTATITGTLDGAGGSDTLDLSGYTTGRVLTLTGLGGTDGFDGTDGSVSGGFSNIDVISGSATGRQTDKLTGVNENATWTVNAGGTTYVSTTTLTFSNIEDLTGGSGQDAFTVGGAHTGDLTGGTGADSFAINAVLTGSVDGEGGSDTLSYAGAAGPATVVLTGLGGTDGFDGTSTSTGGFANIDAGAPDSLQGLDAASVWTVNGGGTSYVSMNTLTFSGIENLTGGTDTDAFTVSGAHTGNLVGGAGVVVDSFVINAVLTGSVAGGGGSDTLSYTGGSAASVVLTKHGHDGRV